MSECGAPGEIRTPGLLVRSEWVGKSNSCRASHFRTMPTRKPVLSCYTMFQNSVRQMIVQKYHTLSITNWYLRCCPACGNFAQLVWKSQQSSTEPTTAMVDRIRKRALEFTGFP